MNAFAMVVVFTAIGGVVAVAGFHVVSRVRDRAEMAAQACIDAHAPELRTIREAGAS